MARETASRLLIEARQRTGLSQRALARRAKTAQSVIARIENGTASPSWVTLERLLGAAGFSLNATLTPTLRGSQDQEDVTVLREMSRRSEP